MKKIYLIITLTSILVSCEKVLDLKPLDRYSSTDVWSDANLVELVVNEVYNSLETYVTGGLSPSSIVDDAYSSFNWCAERTITHGLLTPDNAVRVTIYQSGSRGRWWFYYKNIRTINDFFAKIDDASGNEDLKDRLRGEMYFLRAYCYAELVNFYGGVPLITEVFDIESDFFNVSKSSYEECIDYIVEQCDLAVQFCPYEHTSANRGRATKGAALALKAQELFYAASPLYNNGSFDKNKLLEAKEATEELIYLEDDQGQQMYSLYSPADYRNIFLDYGNSEVIFAQYECVTIFKDRQNTMSRDLGMNSINGFGCYSPLQQLVDRFEVTDGVNTVIPATYDKTTGRTVTTDPMYDDQNPYVNRDPRFYANILYDGALYAGQIEVETYVGGKDSPQGDIQAWNASKTGYLVRKFTSEKQLVFGWPPNEDMMWIIYRLSEFYLNMAEILFETNTTDREGHDALWYVNQIRQRSCVNMPAYTSIDREKIRHERRIELCFEGNRYYDVLRWQIYDQALGLPHYGIQIEKKDDVTKTYTVFEADANVLFDPRIYYIPIPREEINKNPNLEQSPGWN
jgi:hypothetical protein